MYEFIDSSLRATHSAQNDGVSRHSERNEVERRIHNAKESANSQRDTSCEFMDSSLSTKAQNDGVETYKDKTTPHFTSRQDFLDFLGIKLSKTEQNLLIDSDKNANTEKIPLKADIQSYYEREVLPFVPHSWINYQSKEIGYEVLFNKFFYTYTPPRALNEIQGELNELEKGLSSLLSEILK